MIENGINQLVPSVVNAVDALLNQVSLISAGLMNMANELDMAVSVTKKSNTMPEPFTGTVASTQFDLSSVAVSACHGLKGSLCGLEEIQFPDIFPQNTGVFGVIGWALGKFVYYSLVLPIPFVMAGSLGALQPLIGDALKVIRRYVLSFRWVNFRCLRLTHLRLN
jgi:hypothetical protein